ncbi:hypothetical protein JL722_14974 [Aureococcus anophagefferens]|nr:hypothetical protein JL722_14974 [Aureococcus anophagefferens]
MARRRPRRVPRRRGLLRRNAPGDGETRDEARVQQEPLLLLRRPVSRKRQKALASERARLNDTACGCGGAEFDAAPPRGQRLPLGCSTQQHEAFCAPGARNCSIADAVRALDDDYVFVGLTEEYDLSVAVLERLLPQFFAGASAVLHDGHAVPKVTSARNPATGTRGAGAVSKEARKILMNTTSCRAEARFYAAAKRRFWLVAAAVFGDELLDVARTR